MRKREQRWRECGPETFFIKVVLEMFEKKRESTRWF